MKGRNQNTLYFKYEIFIKGVVFLQNFYHLKIRTNILNLLLTLRRAGRHKWRFHGKRWSRVSKLTPPFWQNAENHNLVSKSDEILKNC